MGYFWRPLPGYFVITNRLRNCVFEPAEAQYQCPPRKSTHYGYTECSFDTVVMSRFLDRGLWDAIIGSHKPTGLLVYQAFMRE
ncbi:MAG: hypothetical protein ACXW1W_03510 [Methylococcaceae bacterium]